MSTAAGEIGIGLLGVGTVGGGVAAALSANGEALARAAGAPLVVRRALVRDLKRPREGGLPRPVLTVNPADVVENDSVDIVVELMGGEEPACSLIQAAFKQGKHVVTGNKEVLAKHGPALMAMARANGVGLMFEASVGGGIPIIAPLRRDLAGNNLLAISAIINGTTNYILTRMAQEGASFADALAEAQRLGYAEADPTSDVEGIDAAYKLTIMASLGFNTRVDHTLVHREGISRLEARDFQYADELGYAIKLIARAERVPEGILARVVPTLLPLTHPLARVDGVMNAVQLTGDLSGSVTFQGAGAGAGPTTSAVLADIIHVARGLAGDSPELPLPIPDGDIPLLPLGNLQTRYYVRVTVDDRPGVLAQIASILGQHDVSIAAVTQKETFDDDQTAELVITTHSARESAIQQALEQIVALATVSRLGALLRIEG
jgi:homoserine dehydrogenase